MSRLFNLVFTRILTFDVTLLDWQVIDLGLHLFNLVSVALYDTLVKDSVGACILVFLRSAVLISASRIRVSLLA